MPEKHPNAHRWGGPGASHEDATKPMPDPKTPRPADAVGSNPRVSQVSGGGGEPDEKHSHVDNMRSSKSHATDSPSPTTTRDWRQNRSRRSQAAEERSIDAAEPDAAGPDAEEDRENDGLQVQLNTDESISGSESLLASVEQTVRSTLRRFGAQLTRVEVFVSDVNGGKSGPGDKRCSMEARPKGMAPQAASHTASTVDEAVSGAASKLARVLDSGLGRRSDNKGGESIRGGVSDL